MKDLYETPLVTRYASREFSTLFSEHQRALLYRKLWLSLARAQKKLGLAITEQQLEELETHLTEIPFDRIYALEKKTRHDVMAHLLAWGEQCPKAKPILHLGATSTYVTDNADLILIREGLHLLLQKITVILRHLSEFARSHFNLPCLGFTHYQPAQPTTVGKRASLWLQDLLTDALEWERLFKDLPFLGAKGATGTQASFLTLFQGNHQKVKELELLIAHDFGFQKIIPICGQTYSRKIDLLLFHSFASFASGVHKMGTDLRLLAHDRELREDHTKEQVGSSAMPYKRNPIYSERLCSLARMLLSLTQNPTYTLATQWLERTLDDSANRRICLPEAFLTADALLNLLNALIPNLQVDHKYIQHHLDQELPFLVMEQILMEAVKRGGDRQELHEKLRRLSKEQRITAESIAQDPSFHFSQEEAKSFCDPQKLIGRAPEQVLEFLEGSIAVFLERAPNISISIPDLNF